jgi:uncharacterized protein (DUF433 family)
MALKRKIEAREIVRDIVSGMTDAELMEKYDLSAKGLHSAFEQLKKERENLAVGIVEDIRAGMTDRDLMEKYQLNQQGLKTVFERLVKKKFLKEVEVLWRLPADEDSVKYDELRELPRNQMAYNIIVRDREKPDIHGTILDVNEKGLGVKGIEASAGETKVLEVLSDEYGEFATFTFEGRCRWSRKDNDGDCSAGFEIVEISTVNLEEFRFLIRAHTIGD